jgi:biopolymer transport protein ExbB/TolQ
MMRAFNRLAVAGSANPSQLAGDISDALMITVFSLPVAGIAFCVWIWVTVMLRRKRSLELKSTQHSQSGGDSQKYIAR